MLYCQQIYDEIEICMLAHLCLRRENNAQTGWSATHRRDQFIDVFVSFADNDESIKCRHIFIYDYELEKKIGSVKKIQCHTRLLQFLRHREWLVDHRHGNPMTYSSLALIGGNPVATTAAVFRSAKLDRAPPFPPALYSHWLSVTNLLADQERLRFVTGGIRRPILARSVVASLPDTAVLPCWINRPYQVSLIIEFGLHISG